MTGPFFFSPRKQQKKEKKEREAREKDFLHPNDTAALKAHSFLLFRLNALSLAVCVLQWSVLHRYFLLYRGPWAPQAIGVN